MAKRNRTLTMKCLMKHNQTGCSTPSLQWIPIQSGQQVNNTCDGSVIFFYTLCCTTLRFGVYFCVWALWGCHIAETNYKWGLTKESLVVWAWITVSLSPNDTDSPGCFSWDGVYIVLVINVILNMCILYRYWHLTSNIRVTLKSGLGVVQLQNGVDRCRPVLNFVPTCLVSSRAIDTISS